MNSLAGDGSGTAAGRRLERRLAQVARAFADWRAAGHPPLDRFLPRWTLERPSMGGRDRREHARLFYRLVRERAALLEGGHPRPPRARDDPLVLAAGALWMEAEDGSWPSPEEARAVAGAFLEAPPDPPWGRLPADWQEALARRFPSAEARALARALNRPAPGYDLRVNTARLGRGEARAILAAEGVDAAPTPHAPAGLRLPAGRDVRRSRLYRDGLVEIQDESSQVTALLALPPEGGRVLDYCAGAGGKSLAMAAALGARGGIHAHEPDPGRLRELRLRGRRAGWPPGLVRTGVPGDGERGAFDVVLVDAPCSGGGTLRRAPHLLWRPLDLAACAAREAAILAEAAGFVRPGGLLVYSVCSLFVEEGGEVARAFTDRAPGRWAAADPLPRLRAAGVGDPEVLVRDGTLLFLPHRHATDGMEARLWVRTDG